MWLVSARRISVVELPLDDGDELELSELGGRRIYSVDGTHLDPDTAPAELTQLGEREGTDYAVQAQRHSVIPRSRGSNASGPASSSRSTSAGF